jgi:hypothetical protein
MHNLGHHHDLVFSTSWKTSLDIWQNSKRNMLDAWMCFVHAWHWQQLKNTRMACNTKTTIMFGVMALLLLIYMSISSVCIILTESQSLNPPQASQENKFLAYSVLFVDPRMAMGITISLAVSIALYKFGRAYNAITISCLVGMVSHFVWPCAKHFQLSLMITDILSLSLMLCP